MHNAYFEQFPQKMFQKHSAHATFGKRMMVCAVCAVLLMWKYPYASRAVGLRNAGRSNNYVISH